MRASSSPLLHHLITQSLIIRYHRYIIFYLDLVVSLENISLLYHLALKGKTVKDAESGPYSEVIIFSVYSPDIR